MKINEKLMKNPGEPMKTQWKNKENKWKTNEKQGNLEESMHAATDEVSYFGQGSTLA